MTAGDSCPIFALRTCLSSLIFPLNRPPKAPVILEEFDLVFPQTQGTGAFLTHSLASWRGDFVMLTQALHLLGKAF